MNKFIGAFALLGLIVIASSASAWQSADSVSADPIPNTPLEFGIASSPECPNYSSGTLRLQSLAVGGGSLIAL